MYHIKAITTRVFLFQHGRDSDRDTSPDRDRRTDTRPRRGSLGSPQDDFGDSTRGDYYEDDEYISDSQRGSGPSRSRGGPNSHSRDRYNDEPYTPDEYDDYDPQSDFDRDFEQDSVHRERNRDPRGDYTDGGRHQGDPRQQRRPGDPRGGGDSRGGYPPGRGSDYHRDRYDRDYDMPPRGGDRGDRYPPDPPRGARGRGAARDYDYDSPRGEYPPHSGPPHRSQVDYDRTDMRDVRTNRGDPRDYGDPRGGDPRRGDPRMDHRSRGPSDDMDYRSRDFDDPYGPRHPPHSRGPPHHGGAPDRGHYDDYEDSERRDVLPPMGGGGRSHSRDRGGPSDMDRRGDRHYNPSPSRGAQNYPPARKQGSIAV